MVDNFIQENTWWRRAAKVLTSVLYNTHERDWMELANCLVDTPEDKDFIQKPTAEQEKRWANSCAHCPVFGECFDWANREEITGTYIAGEWRA